MFSEKVTHWAIGLMIVVGGCMAGNTLLAYDTVTGMEVRVETEPDGSGELVPEQLLVPGDTLRVYAVERDEGGDFVQLCSGADWSLQAVQGDVAQEDLAGPGDGSATFSAEGAGSARIQASTGTLTPVPSGRITVLSEGSLPGDGESDCFAGTWHGTLSGGATDTPWNNLGFSMDIRNLEIGALALESEDGDGFFRTLVGSATAVYQNPVSMYPGVQRAFLNRYETSGMLAGKMHTKGWTLEDGEVGWDIELERGNWQPGGYEEAYADGWVYVDDFEGGVLSMRSAWHLDHIEVEPSPGNDRLILSESYSNPFSDDGYEIQGELYKISDEQNLGFPGDVGPGERVETDLHTRKIINVSDLAEVTVNPGAEADISQSVDGSATGIDQFKGTLRHKVQQLGPGQSYEIRTPQAVTGVRGTTLWTKVDADQDTSVDLQEGEIDVSDGQLKRVDASGSSSVLVNTGSVDELSLSDTATSEIGGDGRVGVFQLTNDSTLHVAGGNIDQLRSLDAAALDISGGTLNRLRSEDSSSVDLSGGMLTELQALDSSAVTLYGQNFNLGGDLTWGSNGEILGTGTLSGEWLNPRRAFDISINQNSQGALLRAVETHAVTFNLGEHGTRTAGGELEQTVASGDRATAPEVGAAEGWIFVGWDREFSSVTEDLTVNALYQEDWDADGLPDEWEQKIVAVSSAHEGVADVNPDDDYDGDGWSNLQEYENSTDPTRYVLELQEGWNLLSIGRAPKDYSVNGIFGDKAAEPAWFWSKGRYRQAENIVPTAGQWVRCPQQVTVEINIGAMSFPDSLDSDGDGLCDRVEQDIGSDPNDYILALQPGWNLVSICRVPRNNAPEAIFGEAVIPPVWEWKNGEYKPAEELKPLHGYWVYFDGEQPVTIGITK